MLDEFEGFGSAPYPILWTVERKRILRDVMRTLDKDPEGAILLAVEHHFGNVEKGEPSFSLSLENGRTLHFRGSIDRVDRLHDRASGDRLQDRLAREREEGAHRASQPGCCCSFRSTVSPRRQMFDPDASVSAGYWYISSKGGWRSVDIPIDDEVRDRFVTTLDTITSGIADGVFPAHPGDEGYQTFVNCQWCDFQRICPPDRDRAWERVQHAPALRQYVELSNAEPTGGDRG